MMYQVGFAVFFSCLSFDFCQGTAQQGFTVDAEEQLRNSLLENYSSKSRPSGTTTINLVFNLLTINDLETRTQTFSVSGYFTVVWSDSRLAWNRSDHSDIGFVFSDETEVWRPALVVKNAINDINVMANKDIPFRINSNGRVFWNPPGIYQTNCDIDTTYYPFDTQTCSVEVQSWGYNLRELNLAKFGTGVETDEFSKNGEWDLLESSSKRAERLDGTVSETYATVIFEFKLKRRTAYYGLNIILPVVVLSILSALVFVLPADCGEKMGYSLTVLLAFAVFLTLISDRMPTTSKNTSYMAVYLSVVLCLGGLSVLLTMLSLELYHRQEPMSSWIKSLTRKFLIPLTCARGCRGYVGSSTVQDIKQKSPVKKYEGLANPDKAVWTGKIDDTPPVVRSLSAEDDITWKDVSRCLDIFFFRMFMVITVIVTVVLFSILGLNA